MCSFVVRSVALTLLFLVALPVSAQSQPVSISISGNSANVRIGSASAPLADLRLDFDDASGLTPAALGISAELVNINAPGLLARLPDVTATGIPSSLPLLITIEPPLLGGLSFKRLVHVEVHTHALIYTAGSRFRLLKAPLGGNFRDLTGAVAPGSVRTRGTTGGFSQFLIVADLRPTTDVIAAKIAWLHAQASALPSTESTPLLAQLDAIEAAIGDGDFSAAIGALDAMRARVSARSGTFIPDTWRAARDSSNSAGELLAGIDTLAFSIGYLRDYGD